MWVESILKTGSTFRISLASQQELLEAFRTPERIGLLENLENRRIAKLQRAMTVGMVFGHHDAKIPACLGQRQAVSHFTYKFRAACFVAGVAGQLTFRRSPFAEVVGQCGESNFEIVAK